MQASTLLNHQKTDPLSLPQHASQPSKKEPPLRDIEAQPTSTLPLSPVSRTEQLDLDAFLEKVAQAEQTKAVEQASAVQNKLIREGKEPYTTKKMRYIVEQVGQAVVGTFALIGAGYQGKNLIFVHFSIYSPDAALTTLLGATGIIFLALAFRKNPVEDVARALYTPFRQRWEMHASSVPSVPPEFSLDSLDKILLTTLDTISQIRLSEEVYLNKEKLYEQALVREQESLVDFNQKFGAFVVTKYIKKNK